MRENEAIKELNERIELIEKDYEKEAGEYKEVLETAVKALTEIQQYRAIGTVEEIKEILQIISEGQNDVDESGISTGLLHTLLEYAEYKKIGTVEECREARERQRGKKPIYKHYEDKGEPPYIKISCPNGCRIRLYPVTEKKLAYEHEFCPKCGQKLVWFE